MKTIDDALKLVPADIAPKLEFDGGMIGGVARCYLFPVNGIGIGAQPTKWLAYADAETMPDAIVKAVANLAAGRKA